MRMTPAAVTSVALLACDPLTEEGALARFSSFRQLDVRAWRAGCKAAVLLVLATTITGPLLSAIEEAQKDAAGDPPKLVVVADDLSEQQVVRMIDLELTGLLYRGRSTFNCIVETILLSAEGRLRLPEPVQRQLLGRVKSTGAAQPDAAGAACLGERAVDVLRLLSDGLSTSEVATKLNYSERTIKNIVHEVVTGLNLRNRTHAVAYALRAGVI
ncbi:response regulator transcription factor [Mycobacterium lacus]|nr:response regulator transcription factor [Mycobacterium lacus]ORW00238.1 helix-turn-helix transcriptional regulator [Mycobacterium lacus]